MLAVIRRNPQFRRLWISQLVSQTGDWISRMAVLALISDLSGVGAAAGAGALYSLELAGRLVPTAVMGPIAGPIADRVPRRLLMVLADVARALVVLGLLTVDEPGELPLLYTLVVLQMSLGIFFSAAQSASIPNLVPREELHEAYGLTAATWSFALSIGALACGPLVQLIGVRGVFLLDSSTYVVSAALLYGLTLPTVPRHPDPFRWGSVLLLRDMRAGLQHVRAHGVAPAVFAKAFWGGAGGFLVLLSLTADERFGGEVGSAEAVALAVGALYGARGIGTAIGPILARRLVGTGDAALKRQISLGFLIGAGGYAVFAVCEPIALAFLCVLVAHAGGSTLWVASTTYWQKRVGDAFRGRVFALEFFGMTLAFALGGALAGVVYDATGSLRTVAWSTSALVLVSGAAWMLAARGLRPGEQAEALPSPEDHEP